MPALPAAYVLPPPPPAPPGGLFVTVLETAHYANTYWVTDAYAAATMEMYLPVWLDEGNRSPETMLRGCFAQKKLGNQPHGPRVEIATPEEVMFWVARRYLRFNPTKHWADNCNRWERAVALVEAGLPTRLGESHVC